MTPTAEQATQRITEALKQGPTPGEWTAKFRGYSFDPELRFEEVVGQDGNRLKLTGVSLSSGKECEANAVWIAACSPVAIRTLLDAHASALRDAARFRLLAAEAYECVIPHGNILDGMRTAWITKLHPGKSFEEAIDRALDDNTKGAAE